MILNPTDFHKFTAAVLVETTKLNCMARYIPKLLETRPKFALVYGAPRNAGRDSCREKNSEYTEVQRTLVYFFGAGN
jgi:hypothetical protein